jgi:hypothetical protein
MFSVIDVFLHGQERDLTCDLPLWKMRLSSTSSEILLLAERISLRVRPVFDVLTGHTNSFMMDTFMDAVSKRQIAEAK